MFILRKTIYFFILTLIYQPAFGQELKTGTWGDQGDGTYINPILDADYPDVDIEQVGDTYRMDFSIKMLNWTRYENADI